MKDQLPAGQPLLFETEEMAEWEKHWIGMPEFQQENLQPWQSIRVHFRTETDRQAFAALLGQPIHAKTNYIWFPRAEIINVKDVRFVTADAVQAKYPIYVISKGRWESRLTMKALDDMQVDYRLAVEPQEYKQYAEVISPEKILILPFSNLGVGSIPARNYVWEHAISLGAAKHWILDDNIASFYRLNHNQKIKVRSGVPFKALEDFTDRYENIGLAGMNYEHFALRRNVHPPFLMNTRIYSCILVRNDLPFRWRGKYNEDTDLSLRVLKAGLCTVLFNAFLAKKIATMKMKGGNTDELYQGEGRLKMAEALAELHPDCVKVSRKFHRWQHHVDYSAFKKNVLILKPGMEPPQIADDYGLELAKKNA